MDESIAECRLPKQTGRCIEYCVVVGESCELVYEGIDAKLASICSLIILANSVGERASVDRLKALPSVANCWASPIERKKSEKQSRARSMMGPV